MNTVTGVQKKLVLTIARVKPAEHEAAYVLEIHSRIEIQKS
jgi:hypothetical protein